MVLTKHYMSPRKIQKYQVSLYFGDKREGGESLVEIGKGGEKR